MLAIFLDIETTGLDPTWHHPIDLALKVIDVTTGEEKGSYQTLIKQTHTAWSQSDPASLEVNGYTWESIQTGKEPVLVKQEILALFKSWGSNVVRQCSFAKIPPSIEAFSLKSSMFTPKRG